MPCDLNNWPVCWARYRRLPAAVFLCASVALSCAASGAQPTPYGEYFVRLGEHTPEPDTISPHSASSATSVAPDRASYEQQLRLLEGQGGPYANTLAEPLADLARLHRQGGDVKLAQQAYQRALHVVRVNEGLYSERQVPILKELFELDRMTGDLATLDARYDYYFRLHGNGRPPYTPARLNAALEYLQWQREAIQLEIDQREIERLLALYALNEEILQGVAAEPDAELEGYREIVLSQLRNLYLLENMEQPSDLLLGAASNTRVAVAAWGEEQDVNKHRLEVLQRKAPGRGAQLLEDLIARTPPEQVEALAASYLELADWNQWNDHHTQALAAYEQVGKVLREAGKTALLERWLGQAIELPANGVFWRPGDVTPGAAPVVVQARYDVTARGRADNIETTAAVSENEGKAGRVRRYLAQTRFRPRMVNGEPEAALQLQRDYEVLN